MVYLLAMLPVMILALAYIYNSYRLSNEKIRLQNTADAVAYSVGAIQSKDLNFKAYTNRAMVANQVAIAQAVSLTSWIRWLDVTVTNIEAVTFWIPIVGQVISTIQDIIEAVEQYWSEYVGGYIVTLDAINRGYSGAQRAWHILTIALARDAFVTVAHANDPHIETGFSLGTGISAVSFAAAHNGFSERFDSNDTESVGGSSLYRMDEKRDVTMRSRDPFSWGLSRNYNNFLPRLNLVVLRISVPKAGNTELLRSSEGDGDRPYYTWQAFDTLSFQIRRWRCSWRCRWRRSELPVGWGGAQAGGELDYDEQRNLPVYGQQSGSDRFRRPYRTNEDAAEEIDDNPQNNDGEDIVESWGGYSGLQDFYDLSDRGLIEESPGILIAITKPNGDESIKTLRAMNTMTDDSSVDIEEYGDLHRNRMAAASKVVTYFSRPVDLSGWARRRSSGGSGDVGIEYGNLYNPFWQPKLKDTTTLEAAAINTALGI